MRIYDIPAAIQTLRPGAQWVLRGEEYSGLEWLDTVQTCPTEEELQVEIDRLNNEEPFKECKREAKKRIADSDWAALPDVNLANKEDFSEYRATLRGFILNPVADPVWPVEPEPIWA